MLSRSVVALAAHITSYHPKAAAMPSSCLDSCPRRHLVLHMDINKTIIQADATGGKTMEDVLNSNVAAKVFGSVVNETWVAKYGPLEPAPSGSTEYMSFDDYADQVHPEPTGMQALPIDERTAVWKEVTGKRRAMLRDFTHPGKPGAAYTAFVECQRQALMSTTGAYHSIIPSFFSLVNVLSEQEWSFTLVFRTFGGDLPHVLKEWEDFVMGNHVCKPKGKVLEQMRSDFKTPLTGSIFRSAPNNIVVGFGLSTPASVPPTCSVSDAVKRMSAVPGFIEASTVNHSTFVDNLVQRFASSNAVGGLVDYYPFWAQLGERRSGGKIFPVRVGADDMYQVFFDDNIFYGQERSIVDLYHCDTLETISDVNVEQAYCVGVSAYDAIMNPNYFIDSLSVCLRRQLAQSASNVTKRSAAN